MVEIKGLFKLMTQLNLDAGNQISNLTLAKDLQDMISYGLFSHFKALEPIKREI